MKTVRALAVGAGLALAGSASAEVFLWNWAPGDPGSYSVNNAAGTFESIDASFDDVANEFTWSVTFSDQVTDGFTLAVSPGPNPKGTGGELALVYVDATGGGGTAKTTVYGYNGENTQFSWADGSPLPNGQAPDKIASSEGLGAAAILESSVVDGAGSRTFTLRIDTSSINTHSPLWPGPGGDADWTGLAFGEQLGVWLHPVSGLYTEYGIDGFLNIWGAQAQGWFDGEGFATVPSPAGAVVLGAGGLVALRRRR